MKRFGIPRKTILTESDSEDIVSFIKWEWSTFEELLINTSLTQTELEERLDELLEEGSIKFEDELYKPKNNQGTTENKIVNIFEEFPDEINVENSIWEQWISFEKLKQLMNLESSTLEKILVNLEEKWRIKFEDGMFKKLSSWIK